MNIHSVRLGHACNSSSTHSIVPAQHLTHVDPQYGNGQYGWDWFVLRDPAAKMHYLSVLLRDGAQLDDDLISNITGITPDRDDYIDHQSMNTVALPAGRHIELFARDLAEFLRRDDVAIRGGNDNGDPPEHLNVPAFDFPDGAGCRPDVTPDGRRFWTVMNRHTGDKVRFSFDEIGVRDPDARWDEQPASLDIAYGTLPELVDLKVSGFCPFARDCDFCYMDSDTSGQHASREQIEPIFSEIVRAGVFEVALGGGEPTMWPHLDWLTRLAQDAGVNINLTSKNFAWFAKQSSAETISRLHAVAFSVNNRRDLQRIKRLWQTAGPDGSGVLWPRPAWGATEATVQCVPALLDDALISDIVAFCEANRLRVTLLGFKRTGRATDRTETDDLRWIDALAGRDEHWLSHGVAVDTLMAQAGRERFEQAGVDPVYYAIQEGAFSCYIDATTGRVGASSYVPDTEMVAFDGDLPAAFAAVQRACGLRP